MKPVMCVVCVFMQRMKTSKRNVVFICKLFHDTVSNLNFTASYDWLVVTNEMCRMWNKVVMA